MLFWVNELRVHAFCYLQPVKQTTRTPQNNVCIYRLNYTAIKGVLRACTVKRYNQSRLILKRLKHEYLLLKTKLKRIVCCKDTKKQPNICLIVSVLLLNATECVDQLFSVANSHDSEWHSLCFKVIKRCPAFNVDHFSAHL